MIWTALNIASAALAAWVVLYRLVRHRGEYDRVEQLLMGVMAAMLLLRTGPMLGKYLETTTPFDNWSSTIMQIALASFFGWREVLRERSSARR